MGQDYDKLFDVVLKKLDVIEADIKTLLADKNRMEGKASILALLCGFVGGVATLLVSLLAR